MIREWRLSSWSDRLQGVANCPPRSLIPVVAVNLAIQNHGLVSGGKIGAVAN